MSRDMKLCILEDFRTDRAISALLINKGGQISSSQPQGRSGNGCCRLAEWKTWSRKAVAPEKEREEDGLKGKFLQHRAG